eukprot:TRINITY_DN8639_c0_g1_i2.p1 TRINITY_DN8639_c0_g1~~TRINITY_DN8639_c0_g1_i2.p1  ORF type:complete len:251 (+),score=86.66 TRINITY_DN8639_c0_g1_i2:137-889(+)
MGKEEKAELLAEIVEAERQILLWERKIQLEKEMQEALDPNIGQSENQQLKKEIHRMELRLNELHKRQEDLIRDIERSVYKRDSIQVKYTNKDKQEDQKAKKSMKESTSSQISKQVQTLKGTLNQTLQNTKQIDQNIRQFQQESQQLAVQVQELNERLEVGENRIFEMNYKMNERKVGRLVNICKIAELQARARKIEEIGTNKARLAYPEDMLRNKHSEIVTQNEKIKAALRNFVENNPELNPIVEGLISL